MRMPEHSIKSVKGHCLLFPSPPQTIIWSVFQLLSSSQDSEINFHFLGFFFLVHFMTVMSVALAGSHHLSQRIKVLASSGTSINKKN